MPPANLSSTRNSPAIESPTTKLRGFTSVSEDRLESFYSRYDDLYSILMLIKQGEPIHKLPDHDLFGKPFPEANEQPAVMQREDLEKDLPDGFQDVPQLVRKLPRQVDS